MLNLKLNQNRQFVKCSQKAELYVSLELSPDESTQLLQKSHHVALAIDCSYSMDDQPLANAKDAAIQAAKMLQPNDFVSIVAFSDEAIVMLSQSPAHNENIENVIRQLKVVGGTDLYGGMSKGFDLLQQTADPNTINKLILLTDGLPNGEKSEDDDFKELATKMRTAGVTIDVDGIGIGYNEKLTKLIAEYGGGKWYHIEDSTQLAKTVTVQITELEKTVITNPQLELRMMDGAKVLDASITKPVNEQIDLKQHQNTDEKITFGLKDVIKDQSQVIAMKIAVPPIQSTQSLITAVVMEGNQEISNTTAEISCSDDPKQLIEVDPSPRVLLQISEATELAAEGKTELLETVLGTLTPEEKTHLSEDASKTVVDAEKLSGKNVDEMSEAEKKQFRHDATVIGQSSSPNTDSAAQIPVPKSEDVCTNCNATLKPNSKFCSKCGTAINNQEESN